MKASGAVKHQGGTRALAAVMRNHPAIALGLLRNRYRILLTRGIFGTVVYFEDPETRQSMLRAGAGTQFWR